MRKHDGGPAPGRASRLTVATSPPPNDQGTTCIVTPFPFGLSDWELRRHIRDLRCGGWQDWEVAYRFGMRWAA